MREAKRGGKTAGGNEHIQRNEVMQGRSTDASTLLEALHCLVGHLIRGGDAVSPQHAQQQTGGVGQNRINTYIYTVYLVISKPKILYIHRIHMVLANPTNWPLIILILPFLFLVMSVLYQGIFILISPNSVHNVSKLRLHAHTLKVEAAAWLEGGSRVRDQCPGKDEHVQNEVHALLFCQDHRVRELRKHPFLSTPFFEDFSGSPYLLQQVSLFIISFLGRTLDFSLAF